jgi:hypothetical protein
VTSSTISASRPHLVPSRLWAGGLASGVVAAMIAIVGILICRGILDIAVLAPKGHGTWGGAHTVTYAAGAFLSALLATAILQLLYRFAPQPGSFFGWITALLTLVAVLAPFVASSRLDARIAAAVINGVIGLAIYLLVSGSAARSPAVAGSGV